MESFFGGKKAAQEGAHESGAKVSTEELRQNVETLVGRIKLWRYREKPQIESSHSESGAELNPSPLASEFDPAEALEKLAAQETEINKIIELCDEEEKKGEPGTPDLEAEMRKLLQSVQEAKALLENTV